MKRLRGLLLGFFAFLISAFMISTPVFADPDTTTPDPDTTVVAPADDEGEEEEEAKEPLKCSDQVGALSWLVCPGTGLLANAIDGAYNILTYLIEIDPLPNDADSPFRMIWTYCRNITNILFIIALLICILSQITGSGISNYGIKRMLPRIVVIVILSNLSYFICQAAVDLSNIIGNGLSSIFELVQNQAIANGAISIEMVDVGVGTIINHFLGIGVAAATAITVLANVGGFTGLIWLILPVVLSGVLAVVSAVLTMAARQSLIYLLVMISPVAIVAYSLPNTEKWTQKWYSLFMRMLFFYPMFTLLYSASRLAGLVIMSTAANAGDSMGQSITLVLGIAVQLIPLFMSIPMMRMSGTFLSKISGIVSTISAPAVRSFGGMSVERRKHAIERQRFSNGISPSTHLAHYLQQRKTDRINEIAEMERSNRDTYEARYRQGYYNSRGQLTSRGAMHYEIAAKGVQNARIVKQIDTDFDEGFNTRVPVNEGDPQISDRIGRNVYRRIAAANNVLDTELNLTEIVNARADKVRRDNIERRSVNLRDTIRGESGNTEMDNAVRSMVNDSFHVTNEHDQTMARNAVLARAITQKRKMDTEARSEYLELYSDYPAGALIKQALNRSFKDHDYNSMEAAIQVMTQRGDQNWILEEIEKNSRNLYASDDATMAEKNEMMRFQKHLLDSTLPLKKDNVMLAAWAKANMIRRAKHEMGKNVAAFISFKDFINGETIQGEDESQVASLTATNIINAYKDGAYFIDQDRTVFQQMLDFKVKSDDQLGEPIVKSDLVLFREKDIRSGLASGKMDGEQLDNALDYFTNGYFKTHDISDTTNAPAARKNGAKEDYARFAEEHMGSKTEKGSTLKFIYDMLGGMTAKQIATSKSTTFKMLNHILGKFGEENDGFDGEGHSIELREILHDQIEALKKPNAAALRDSMNPDIRKILGLTSDDINGS